MQPDKIAFIIRVQKIKTREAKRSQSRAGKFE